ncbi:MAG: outer membrane lipoprotein chaperone LolA [Nitrospinae bacterium]|nr:outer membrane lipoprotein chaperone LolA [Nitrospinota bacterium]MDA1108776.1 outer membrane lipoprotein chaperone LolA [Nitrospinota bacterium]
MKKILLSILILSLFFCANSWAGEEQTALDAIQKQYESVNTFTAKFLQKSYVKTMNQALEAKGDVLIKKPGKMKWIYNAPDPQVLVSDNKVLWLYIPDEKQVTKAPLDSIYSSNTPALFLAGKGKLSDTFNVVKVSKENNLILVDLIPIEEDNSLDRLVLFADNKNYQIVGSSVYDKLGNKTEIQFSDIKVNVKIPEETFRFKIPQDVELLDYTAK